MLSKGTSGDRLEHLGTRLAYKHAWTADPLCRRRQGQYFHEILAAVGNWDYSTLHRTPSCPPWRLTGSRVTITMEPRGATSEYIHPTAASAHMLDLGIRRGGGDEHVCSGAKETDVSCKELRDGFRSSHG